MALIVEDGTGLADAETYDDVTEPETWLDRRGYPLFKALTGIPKERAYLRATDLVERAVRPWVKGQRLRGPDQRLHFPRYGFDLRPALRSDFLNVSERSWPPPTEYLEGIYLLTEEASEAAGVEVTSAADSTVAREEFEGMSTWYREGAAITPMSYLQAEHPEIWRLLAVVCDFNARET